jgi:hypothetical protein
VESRFAAMSGGTPPEATSTAIFNSTTEHVRNTAILPVSAPHQPPTPARAARDEIRRKSRKANIPPAVSSPSEE